MYCSSKTLASQVYHSPTNTKHLYNVGPTSKTLKRRCTNGTQMFCVCWEAGGGWAGREFQAACLESGRSRVRAPLWHTSVKETKCFFPAHSLRFNNVERLRDQEVACSTSYRQGSNFEFCAWMAVSSHSSHHPQDILLVQLSLDVHKGGLRSHSFYHFTNLP